MPGQAKRHAASPRTAARCGKAPPCPACRLARRVRNGQSLGVLSTVVPSRGREAELLQGCCVRCFSVLGVLGVYRKGVPSRGRSRSKALSWPCAEGLMHPPWPSILALPPSPLSEQSSLHNGCQAEAAPAVCSAWREEAGAEHGAWGERAMAQCAHHACQSEGTGTRAHAGHRPLEPLCAESAVVGT